MGERGLCRSNWIEFNLKDTVTDEISLSSLSYPSYGYVLYFEVVSLRC